MILFTNMMGIGMGETVERAAVLHANESAHNSVVGLASKIARVAANNSLEFGYNSDSKKSLPVNLPLLGGGNLKLGSNDSSSHSPRLFIDCELPDTHLEEDSSEIKLKHYSGRFDLGKEAGKEDYIIRNMSLSPGTDKYEMEKSLARLDIKKDVDLEKLKNPTSGQRALLKEFGIELPE